MKHTVSLLATTGGILFLLMLSLFSSGPIDAQPVSQVTITPTVFNYLPLVAKEPTLTPTVTPTPTLTPTPTSTPMPGTPWSGEGVSFRVSADGRQVCHFEKTWDWPGACGYALWHHDPCVDIDATGHFFGQFSQHYPQPATFTYAGDFTSSTTADGTWSVTRGACGANGTWSASR